MKVDVIVNSMVQQIDRNLKTQVVPAVAFRAGEILYGRVMLAADDRPQIRLDSGALLNALPSGDVQLFAGATVTLRVSGNVEGQLVMQLLNQEPGGSDPVARQSASGTGTKIAAASTPQGRAVLQAMEAMRVPLRDETVQRSLEILSLYPDLEPEKAVFMAANRIPATQVNVDALNRLVDGGATTGGELMKLVEILTSQALESENVRLTQAHTPAEGAGAAQPMQPGNIPAAEAGAAPPMQPANVEAWQEPVPAQAAADADVPAAGRGIPAMIGGWSEPEMAAAAPGLPDTVVLSSEAPAAVRGAALHPESDGMLELQSLIYVALGQEAAEKYSGAALALQRYGLADKAVQLALDGSFTLQDEFDVKLNVLVSALPEDEAAGTRAFLVKLADGVRSYAEKTGLGPDIRQNIGTSTQPLTGVPRIVNDIMELFARIEADGAESANELQKAASQQHKAISHIAAALQDAGGASPAAVGQLNRVESHVWLLDNISQYAYQQIPVQLNGRNKTVELYVLNRGKGGRKINPENASILIALDTENMGHLETLISVSRKNLRLRFGVENPGLMGYVESFTTDIGQAMQQIGYRLSDMRMQVTSRPVTPLRAMESAEPMDDAQSRLDIKV